MHHRVEAFDIMQHHYAVTGFNDHQVHCQMAFREALDESALRRAVLLTLRSVPILATRFAPQLPGPVWESLSEADMDRAFAALDNESAFETETTLRLDEERGPQVRVTLLRGEPARLTVTMNHMIADGAGFKQYLYLLCDAYSALVANQSCVLPVTAVGGRDARDVLRQFGLAAKLHAMTAKVNTSGAFVFPYSPCSQESRIIPFISNRTIDREAVSKMRAFCKRNGATLNDAVLTAFYRVLARHIGGSAWKDLEIPMMVDLRRHLPAETQRTSLRNLASMEVTRVCQQKGERFEETLRKVTTVTEALKRRNIGLSGLVKLSTVFSLCGQRLGSRLLKRALKTPLICMTNIGELDMKRLCFGGSTAQSAFVCGSIKYRPHFQLAVSGFDGTLTLSSNLYGSAEDRRQIDSFLQEVEKELVA